MGRWLAKSALKLVAAAVLASAALVLPWRWIPPPTSAFMLREQFNGHVTRQRWLAYPRISRNLALCVIAAEDQKFAAHNGFDVDAIVRATQERRRNPRGASTISQQLAKNLFLWPGRSLVRKGLEAWFTVWLEQTWPKRRILEVYLNVIEFGPGVFGAATASELIFGKPASDLSLEESALLAAVLPNPKRMSAAHPSAYVSERAGEIERVARGLGTHFVAGI
ncbi:MAG TPA: monofunctional biosynthetic peptidoglycan transglycosylase [Myxococcota bacterium]|nr:monofunctional biosynthetic peptidoglycan transglycosylase [Myxococcota bacterium]